MAVEATSFPPHAEPTYSQAYKRYVLGAMTLVYTLNFFDRGLMILLLQPIKEDLHLSDTQLGFLTGIAFGLFYATLGLPIARWADRGNRVTITSLAIALWGLTVMACLVVSNFVQLLFARIAAAVGEAGCLPPTYSLVGDYYSGANERPRALSIYMLAGPLASMVSLGLGGWLNELYGWRATFFLMGLPALAVALLVKWTVREPRLQASAQPVAPRSAPRTFDVMKIIWRQRACRHLSIGLVLLYLLGYGLGPWYAAFMIRSHAMGSAELGVWLGLVFGISGIVGTLAGGYITARWFARSERTQMRLSAATIALLVPGLAAFLLLPGKVASLIALTCSCLVWGLCYGPVFALMQRLVAGEIRATTLAITMLFSNLIGMGVGPQVVGILSDTLSPRLGSDSLRYAMLIMSLVALWAAYHFWQVSRTVKADLLSVEPALPSQ